MKTARWLGIGWVLAICVVGMGARESLAAEEPSGGPSKPFFLAWDAPADAIADARFLNESPAGGRGPVVVRDGHLAFGDGTRARFWGTNLSGDAGFPPKEAAARVADRLAKYGFNLVRFHGLDGFGKGIFDRTTGDTRHFDPEQLDRLDNMIAELEKRGIYVNLNLHVGRRFTKGDGVAEPDWLVYAKYCVIFDPRMIELQKEYARQLFTHRNPYTGKTYAEDPAVILVEMTNENSLLGGWTSGFLRGQQRTKPNNAWTDIPPFYGEELTRFYNQWLAQKYPTRAALAKAWGEGSRKAGAQLLVNGDFVEAKKGWTFYARKPADAQIEFGREEGKPCAKIVVAAVSDAPWNIMLTQSGLKLRKGEKYAVRFRVKASSPRKVGAEAAHSGPDPYRGYGSKSSDATAEWSDQRFTFVAPEDDDSVRVSFHLGAATGTVWLENIELAEAAMDGLRDGEDAAKGTVRRLSPDEFGSVTAARFRDEGCFLFDTELAYYRTLYDLLKKELGVKALVEGTNHNYGLPCLWAESSLDLMDCHAYWQHPSFPRQPWSRTDWTIGNTAMLDAPERNSIAGLCRSAFESKPFTVSEYNHPFPNEYGCEMPLLTAAYAALQDWDAFYSYTFCHQWREKELGGNEVTGYFDVVNEVSKMAQMPTAALLFRRGDVAPARKTVAVSYDANHCFDSLRDPKLRDGFRLAGELSPLLPLVHRFRVAKFDAPRTTRAEDVGFVAPKERIASDTGELVWNAAGRGTGYLTIDAPRAQAAVGWLGGRKIKIANATFAIKTSFAAVSAVALDGRPLGASERILVVAAARCANTGMKWNEPRNSVNDNWGGPPVLIEPVEGRITLTRAAGTPPLKLAPLDGRGVAVGTAQSLPVENASVAIPLSADSATVWYALTAGNGAAR